MNSPWMLSYLKHKWVLGRTCSISGTSRPTWSGTQNQLMNFSKLRCWLSNLRTTEFLGRMDWWPPFSLTTHTDVPKSEALIPELQQELLRWDNQTEASGRNQKPFSVSCFLRKQRHLASFMTSTQQRSRSQCKMTKTSDEPSEFWGSSCQSYGSTRRFSFMPTGSLQHEDQAL